MYFYVLLLSIFVNVLRSVAMNVQQVWGALFFNGQEIVKKQQGRREVFQPHGQDCKMGPLEFVIEASRREPGGIESRGNLRTL